MTTYLRPSRPIAADVVLTADPATAMAIAQEVIERPLMANHSYGLWGYTGQGPDGAALTVHSTGIGGSSIAAVLGELGAHGARRAVRVSTAAALGPRHRPGERLVATAAIGADGTSRTLSDTAPPPDRELAAALLAAAGGAAGEATVVSTDVAVSLDGAVLGDALHRAREQGATLHDLETAALFAAGAKAGIAVAAALAVAGAESTPEELDEALLALAAIAVRALARKD